MNKYQDRLDNILYGAGMIGEKLIAALEFCRELIAENQRLQEKLDGIKLKEEQDDE